MSPKSFEAVWLKFCRDESRQEFCFPRRNIVEIPVKIALLFLAPRILPRLAKHPSEILATEKLFPGENLDKIRGRIPARFWPLGFSLPGENHGEIRGRIPARFWLPRFLLPGENHGEIPGRIAARFWPLVISLSGENLAGIPPGFPPREKIPAAKISPRFRRDPSKIPVLILPGYIHFYSSSSTGVLKTHKITIS